MLLLFFWFFTGLLALIGGAELLVRSASRTAIYFGISKLVVALTVVAFGTSAPELAVSIEAALNNQTDLMLGNVVGSNIANILLILGISALIIPLKVNVDLIKSDVPIMIGVTLILIGFAFNGIISFWESLTFVILLLIYLLYLARQSGKTDFIKKEDRSKTGSLFINITLGVVGLIALIFGARWLVSSAVEFAIILGVSELVIGLTVVSIGTSLPEIVTSVVAALKGERDIAVGSVVGSCILNILAVLGITGLILQDGIAVQDVVLRFDLMILLAASVACIPIFFTGHVISRLEGFLFLSFYAAYILYLFLYSTEHQFLEPFSTVMLMFVLPITGITILMIAARELKKRWRFRGMFKDRKPNE